MSNQFAEMHVYLENLKNEFSRLQVQTTQIANRGASFRIQNVGMTVIQQAWRSS